MNPLSFLYVNWLYSIYLAIIQILDNQGFGLLRYIQLFSASCKEAMQYAGLFYKPPKLR